MTRFLIGIGLGMLLLTGIGCGKKGQELGSLTGTWYLVQDNRDGRPFGPVSDAEAGFDIFRANGTWEDQNPDGSQRNTSDYKVTETTLTLVKWDTNYAIELLSSSELRLRNVKNGYTFQSRKITEDEKNQITARNKK